MRKGTHPLLIFFTLLLFLPIPIFRTIIFLCNARPHHCLPLPRHTVQYKQQLSVRLNPGKDKDPAPALPAEEQAMLERELVQMSRHLGGLKKVRCRKGTSFCDQETKPDERAVICSNPV